MFTFCLQDLPKPIRANFILNVETDELYITAGLQDRVVQVSDTLNTTHISVIFIKAQISRSMNCFPLSLKVYEGLVYMDFSKKLMEEQGYGTEFATMFMNAKWAIETHFTNCLSAHS